jgi:hypothetical protein
VGPLQLLNTQLILPYGDPDEEPALCSPIFCMVYIANIKRRDPPVTGPVITAATQITNNIAVIAT